MSFKNFLIISLLIILAFTQQFAQVMSINQTYHINLKQTKTKSYQFQIDNKKFDDQSYLFFIVDPEDYFQWQVTQINIHNFNTSQLIIKCKDLCIINKNQLNQITKINIEIKCITEKCKFSFTSYWDKSSILETGAVQRITSQYFSNVSLYTINIRQQDFVELRILLTTEIFIDSPITLVGNYGETFPTKQSFHIKSIHLWYDGKGIFIKKQQLISNTINILIQCPSNKILNLEVFLIKKFQNELSFESKMFDYLDKNDSRVYYLNLSKSFQDFKAIQFYVSTITGYLQCQFYSDKTLTNKIYDSKNFTARDMKFKIIKQNWKNDHISDIIYIKIISTKFDTIFDIKIYEVHQTYSWLRTDFEEQSELYDQQIDVYFVSFGFGGPMGQYELVINNNAGKVRPYISYCRGFQICNVNNQSFLSNKSKYNEVPYKESIIDNVVTYQFTAMMPQQFTKLMIIIFAQKNNSAKYSIKFKNKQFIRLLRQDHPNSDRINAGQIKYFAFFNLNAFNTDIQEVKIHLLQISGSVKMIGSLINPRQSTSAEIAQSQILPINNILTFSKDNLINFIIIQGNQLSYFCLTVVLIRPTNITQDINELDTYNIFLVSQFLQYQYILQPNHTQILKLAPKSDIFNIKVSHTIPVEYCLSSSKKKAPIKPNCDLTLLPQINNFIFENTHEKYVTLGIHNPSDKISKVKFQYSDAYFCELSNLGEVWIRQLLLQYQALNCVRYVIKSLNEDIQIIISLHNLKYTSMKIEILVNQTFVTELTNSRHYILQKQTIKANCRDYSNVALCFLKIIVSDVRESKIQILAQHFSKEITLIDGVAQIIYDKAGINYYRNFIYTVLNIENIRINLENILGSYRFYINIISQDQYQKNKANLSSFFPTSQSYKYKSLSSHYSLFQNYYLTDTILKQLNFKICIILISVESADSVPIVNGKFSIEVIQNIKSLKEHTQSIGFLQQYSIAYYKYYYPYNQGSIILSLSTQNTECANMKLLNEYDGNSLVLAESQNEQLIYQDARSGDYFIKIEANKECQYSISASSTKIKIHQLTQGVFKDIKLQTGEKAYFFYYNHLLNSSIKLMSFQKSGQLLMMANVTQLYFIQTLKQQSDIDQKNFIWNWSYNMIAIDKSDQNFCTNCFYLFVIEALQSTVSSLILYTQQMIIPLINKKKVNDILKPNQKILYRFTNNKIDQAKIYLRLIYGAIQINVKYQNTSDYYKYIESKEYNEISFNNVNTSQIIIQIIGIQSSLYSLQLKSTALSSDYINRGFPYFLSLKQKSQNCINGTIEDIQQNIMVSVDQENKNQLENLKLVIKDSNSKIQNYSKQIIQNLMTIKFKAEELNDYSFCFSENRNAIDYILFTSVGTLTILPEDRQFYVEKSKNFSLFSKGKILLEIYQCEDRASILLSKRYYKIGGSQSEVQNWRKIGYQNIVEVNQYGPLYMNVDGTKTLIKWKHVDEETGEGLGYHSFQPADFSYEILGSKQLLIEIQPLKNIKKYDFLQINRIKYILRVSHSNLDLKRSTNCNLGTIFKKSQQILNQSKQNFTKIIKFIIQQQQIKKILSVSNYFTFSIVAQLDLINNQQESELYKFFYGDQNVEFPDSYFQQVQQQKSKSWVTIFVIILISVLVLLFIIIGYRRHIQKRRSMVNKQQNFISQASEGNVEMKEVN